MAAFPFFARFQRGGLMDREEQERCHRTGAREARACACFSRTRLAALSRGYIAGERSGLRRWPAHAVAVPAPGWRRRGPAAAAWRGDRLSRGDDDQVEVTRSTTTSSVCSWVP